MQHLIKSIGEFLSSKQEQQLQFLIQISNQNSYSFNRAGVTKVARDIIEQLNGILPVHDIVRQKKFADHHILRSKKAEKYIYLVGHMDTVFPPEHSFQSCWTNENIIKGPGTADMKGGLTVIVYALKALESLSVLNELPISVILTSDEEAGSKTSYHLFERERQKALICLVAECAGLNNEIVISRNGKLGARLKSFGRAHHVGSVTQEKSSAILEMAHKIIALEALNNSLPGISLNVGKIEGGLGPATIASQATCYIDVRWKEEINKNTTLKRIEKEIAKNFQPECYSEFEILNSRPAMPDSGTNREIITLLQQIGQELGQNIPTEHRRGSSDANFFGSMDIPTIDGLGPIGELDHTENEYIVISSLRKRSRLLANFLLNYGQSAGFLS